MANKHFSKPPKCESVLWRTSTYRDNCKNGFCEGSWEAHHITCSHAVEGRKIEKEKKKYVEDCLWITKWDLNDSSNLIGLPKNRQYRTTDGKKPLNMCSHQVDHNTSDGYTSECKKWLKENVWNTLCDKRKKHEVTAKAIKKQLEKCTSVFKKKLETRGMRKGGTLVCWQKRFQEEYEDIWYHPFSMAKKPRKRYPGISNKNLKSIFSLIK
ncbi:MAG: AHH domain-containing protein [bacterium]